MTTTSRSSQRRVTIATVDAGGYCAIGLWTLDKEASKRNVSRCKVASKQIEVLEERPTIVLPAAGKHCCPDASVSMYVLLRDGGDNEMQ